MADKCEKSNWELWREREEWARRTIAEIVEDGRTEDISDAIWQECDGLHDVIYYYAAWDTVNQARECDTEIYDEAYTRLEDLSSLESAGGLDQLMCLLSFHIHECLLWRAWNEREDDSEE